MTFIYTHEYNFQHSFSFVGESHMWKDLASWISLVSALFVCRPAGLPLSLTSTSALNSFTLVRVGDLDILRIPFL